MDDLFAFSTARQKCHADCLLVNLKAQAITLKKIELTSEINFSDGWETLSTTRYLFLTENWRVKYAIRQGELAFTLVGLKSPLENRKFVEKLPVHLKVVKSISIESTAAVSKEESQKKAVTASIGTKISSKPEMSFGLSDSDDKGWKDTSSQSGKVYVEEKHSEQKAVLIHSKGPEERPVWCFESALLRKCLQGCFKEKLADLFVCAGPIDIQAQFTTSFEQIEIKEVDSPEFHARPDKWKIAMTATFRTLLHQRFSESDGMTVFHIKGAAS